MQLCLEFHIKSVMLQGPHARVDLGCKIWLKSRDITEVHPILPVLFPSPSFSGDAQCGTSAEGERETVRATINGGKVPLTAEKKKKKRNPFGATRREEEGRERKKGGSSFVDSFSSSPSLLSPR